VTTPRAVLVISPASFGVLTTMSVTAERLAFPTSPRPLDDGYGRFLAFS
jgi:hypothetical protein